MATPNMNLTLPTVSVTLGPTWASELNAAITTIDAHDHTSGKGIAITTAAINIDDEFHLNGYRLTDTSSLQLNTAVSPVSGLGFENSLSTASGDLYWTNNAGVAVQITDGGSIVSPTTEQRVLPYDSTTVDIIIGPTDSVVFVDVNSSGAAKSVTLPLISAVAEGRFYVIKDKTGSAETNNITVFAAGADTIDGQASVVINSNWGGVNVISDGVGDWKLW